MAYVKTTWVNGETPINADNLNNIEGGIKDNETAINDITGTILWTNENPEISLTGTNITLSSSDYDVLEIYYYNWSTSPEAHRDLLSQRIIKGYGTNLTMQLKYNDKSFLASRRIGYVDSTTLAIDDCYAMIEENNFTNNVRNHWCVPVYIVGYKTGLFGGQS